MRKQNIELIFTNDTAVTQATQSKWREEKTNRKHEKNNSNDRN